VRKVTSLILFVVLGAGLPLSVAAQMPSTNDSARIAAQKKNAKRSHKEMKARNKQMKKARKAQGKPAKHQVQHAS
jgi:hypothetical protein